MLTEGHGVNKNCMDELGCLNALDMSFVGELSGQQVLGPNSA